MQSSRPLRVLIHPLTVSYLVPLPARVDNGAGASLGGRLPALVKGQALPSGELRRRPGRCSGTGSPRSAPRPSRGYHPIRTGGARGGAPGDVAASPAVASALRRRPGLEKLPWAGRDRGAALRPAPPPLGNKCPPAARRPARPGLTRHRPSTNTRGSRWQAMVALGRSCRSTSSIAQSMKLQSPPPSSASAAPENGAKGRRVAPGRARASAASAASLSGGPAAPSSIPAPARPRRLSRARAREPGALPSAGSG